MDIIRDEHMKKRCCFIAAVCGASLYGWINCSLFDPITNSFFTLHYQNCLLVLFYLGWDTYHMTLSPNRHILYRTDLIIHHVVSFVSCVPYFNIASLETSHILLMECISVMNYVWRNNPILLKIWRTASIFCVRLPISSFLYFYYHPNVLNPYLATVVNPLCYKILVCMSNTFLFYMCYDIFILWKLYAPTKKLKM